MVTDTKIAPPEGGAFDKWDAGKPGDKFTPKASCTVKALWTHTHNGVKTAAKGIVVYKDGKYVKQ